MNVDEAREVGRKENYGGVLLTLKENRTKGVILIGPFIQIHISTVVPIGIHHFQEMYVYF